MHRRRDREHSARVSVGRAIKQRGFTHAQKHSGTFGLFNFHKDVSKQVFSCSNRQYGSSDKQLGGCFPCPFLKIEKSALISKKGLNCVYP